MKTADLVNVFEDTQSIIRANEVLNFSTQVSREKTKCMIPHFLLKNEKLRALNLMCRLLKDRLLTP